MRHLVLKITANCSKYTISFMWVFRVTIYPRSRNTRDKLVMIKKPLACNQNIMGPSRTKIINSFPGIGVHFSKFIGVHYLDAIAFESCAFTVQASYLALGLNYQKLSTPAPNQVSNPSHATPIIDGRPTSLSALPLQ